MKKITALILTVIISFSFSSMRTKFKPSVTYAQYADACLTMVNEDSLYNDIYTKANLSDIQWQQFEDEALAGTNNNGWDQNLLNDLSDVYNAEARVSPVTGVFLADGGSYQTCVQNCVDNYYYCYWKNAHMGAKWFPCERDYWHCRGGCVGSLKPKP